MRGLDTKLSENLEEHLNYFVCENHMIPLKPLRMKNISVTPSFRKFCGKEGAISG